MRFKLFEMRNDLTLFAIASQCDIAIFRILDLSFNRITEIKNLDKLVKLEKLYLCANKISKIENLDKLTKLTMLELGDNRLRVWLFR